MIDALARDLAYGLRMLVRGRAFTAVAVLTLALGIGANSAIFSLVNGLLLRPLPYPQVDRLVWIATPMVTSDNVGEWRAGMRTLERVAAFGLRSAVLTGRGPAQRLSGMIVTEDYLPLLGATPVRGRLWTADELSTGGPGTIVVSQSLWQRLGPDAVPGATTLTLDGASYTVIGVLPASFPNLHYRSDVWWPAAGATGRGFNLIALRRADATVEAVRLEATALAERIDVAGLPIARRFANVNALAAIYTGDIRTPLLVFLAAAGFVLLIACANVANLLLARAAGRQREMVVRTALGAGRPVLLRQLLSESAVLGLAGALAGALVGFAGLRAVLSLVPEYYSFGRIAAVQMDGRVLGFTFVIAFATTLLAGLAPALHAVRHAASAATGSVRLSSTRTTRRSHEALMAAEIALALVLLIGTVLLIRTFLVLRPAAPGFEVNDRMVASIALPDAGAIDPAGFARRLLEEVDVAAPSARAAIATDVPLSGLVMMFPLQEVDGQPVDPTAGRRNDILFVAATPDYFDVMGMPLVRGRRLMETDVPGSTPVIVVNERAAAQLWPDGDALGRILVLDLGDRSAELVVAGVVGNTRASGNHLNASATAFAAFWQMPWNRFQLVVHQPRGGELTADAVRRIVESIDAGVPVGSTAMLEQMVARTVAERRFHMTLMAVFAGLALALALVGCYGVLSYSVAQRTREIGVRVALGATHGAILRTVVLRGVVLVALGLAAGTLIALATTRVLGNYLFGVPPTDVATFAGAAAGLALVSLLAVYLPARRAASVQPVEALRTD